MLTANLDSISNLMLYNLQRVTGLQRTTMLLSLSWGFYLTGWLFALVQSSCPSQCSCFYHNLSDGSKTRSIICNDPEISLVPANFPVDASKLRIEKTAINRIPSEAFYYLSNLEFLSMSFNSLSLLNKDSFRGLYSLEELRLDGNSLTSFPWESLIDMPSLRLLDLHNNQMTSVPKEANVYTKNLTYLDLSSNQFVTLPSDLLSSWLSENPTQNADTSKLILGLHENPWMCDCRLFDLVQFQKSPSSSIALIDTRLRCSDPEGLSGILFRDAELRRCQGPQVRTAVARVRSAEGKGVLLRCSSIGIPVPELSWRRADGKPVNGTVQQETSKDGMALSILNVKAASQWDSGRYICKATNFAGSTEAVISLIITDALTRANQTIGNKKARGTNPISKAAAYQEELSARYMDLTTVAPTLLYSKGYNSKSDRIPESLPDEPTPTSTMVEKLLDLEKTNFSNLVGNASSLRQDADRVVRSVKVVGDTDHTVFLNWRAPAAKNTTVFNVLYAVFGERDMQKITVGPGKSRIIIHGLQPKTKYIACVCIRGLIPKKEQCVIFSTDEAASASGTQKLINVVVITVACVIVGPLTVIVCCGALKRRLKKLFEGKTESQNSYVTFETHPTGTRTSGQQGEYLQQPNPEESNRLLSARSSLDSEATTKLEGPPNEYFC